MTARPILIWPDPRLSEICAPAVFTAKTADLVRDLFDSMYAAAGRGLAAPQIGLLQRIFVMDAGWKDGAPTPRICINPKIMVTSDDTAKHPEGCLSLPGVTADVVRPALITLLSYDLDGQPRQWALQGFEAICAQHELDHLDGILTFDRLSAVARVALKTRYNEMSG